MTTSLNSLLLADLKQMAGGLGIKGISSMKKVQLVEAIAAARSGGQPGSGSGSEQGRPARQTAQAAGQKNGQDAGSSKAAEDQSPAPEQRPKQKQKQKQKAPEKQQQRDDQEPAQPPQSAPDDADRREPPRRATDRQADRRPAPEQPAEQPQQQPAADGQEAHEGQEEGGSRRNRRRRGRDRDRNRPVGQPGSAAQRYEPEQTVLDDDVLVPAAGILDVLDNYAFVRTSGYLAGPDDVYLSLSMVRKYGLRRGDALVGQVRQPREGERKEKFNPMVRIDSVNGADPESARTRVDFAKLTPLHPSERLRLETTPTNLVGRVVDLAAPLGKGQRGLIVSPARAGKTMLLQSIATSITSNNPECHLMVVLLDERPEEVTDFERLVKGEVISSTFDRPASDHTVVAELAIERAKRLVELGHDVVILLDGLTRLARAYHLSMPASGRILAGGVDAEALHPPKKFFGSARNIENGGSLTILATATVESGSQVDEVIFEELQGSGNWEIRLRRDFADRRLFPSIDAVQSGTRREELLMGEEELNVIWKLRRVLANLEGEQALELLLERLRKSQTNIEFLMQVQKNN